MASTVMEKKTTEHIKDLTFLFKRCNPVERIHRKYLIFCTFRKHTFSYKNKHLYFSDEFFGRNLFRLGILLLLQLLLLLLLHQLLLVLKLQLLLLQHFLFRCGGSGLGKELLLLTEKFFFWNTLKYQNRLC